MTTSPARKRRKRAFVALLFLILILCLPLLFADALLGFALIQIFARGTGCDVHLRSPQVSFFPLRASVKDVVIRAPQERSDEGFFADTISLEIIGSELLKRRVVLTNFVIDGAQANSHSEESAFFRTLEFRRHPR
jgi:hypothetical protein